MNAKHRSSRRSFLKGSALLVSPLAIGAAPAILADENLKARVARLEDEAAIRILHRTWLRKINVGATSTSLLDADGKGRAVDQRVRGVGADHTGEPDSIEVASDGKSAAGHYHCCVEFATPIARDCTLAQMAHAQGGGFVRHTEPRVLNVKYVKSNGGWTVAEWNLHQRE